MTQRSFIKAVKKEVANAGPEPLVFDLSTYDEDPEGELLENGRGNPLIGPDGQQVRGKMIRQDVFTAVPPTDDQLLISMVTAGRSDASSADQASVIFDFFRNALTASEYRTLIARLRDRDDEVEMETLVDIFQWLQEEWAQADFPTESPSDSSRRPLTTGKSSTGRSRSKASTPSKAG
jgi:hypothetical protein